MWLLQNTKPFKNLPPFPHYKFIPAANLSFTGLTFPSVCMILSVTLHRYIQNSTNRIYVVYVACWTLKNKTSSHSGKHTRCFSPFNHTESALPIFRAGIIINFILLFIIIPSAI